MEFPEVNAAVLALVVGVVQWLKTKANVKDAVAEAVSFVLGGVMGVLYQLSVAGTPEDMAGYFVTAFAFLAYAIAPAGLYKFAGAVAEKFSGE